MKHETTMVDPDRNRINCFQRSDESNPFLRLDVPMSKDRAIPCKGDQYLIDELNRVKWMLSDEERSNVNKVLDRANE